MASLRARRQAGVTLAEMLVAVAVIAAGAAIAVPAMDPVTLPYADAAAGEVARALRFAQREAVRTGAWYTVKFDTGAQTLRVYRLTTSGIVGEDTSYPVLHPIDRRKYDIAFGAPSMARATITLVDFDYDKGATNANFVSFGPDGTPADIHGWLLKDTDALKVGIVTIVAGNQKRTLTVDPATGRVGT